MAEKNNVTIKEDLLPSIEERIKAGVTVNDLLDDPAVYAMAEDMAARFWGDEEPDPFLVDILNKIDRGEEVADPINRILDNVHTGLDKSLLYAFMMNGETGHGGHELISAAYFQMREEEEKGIFEERSKSRTIEVSSNIHIE